MKFLYFITICSSCRESYEIQSVTSIARCYSRRMAVTVYTRFLCRNGRSRLSSKGNEFGRITGETGRLHKIFEGSQCKTKSQNNAISIST